MPSNSSDLLKFVNIRRYDEYYSADIHDDVYFGLPVRGILEAEEALRSADRKPMAYLSMEYGLATNVYNVFKSSRPVLDVNRLSENEVFSNERISDYLFSLKIDALLDLPIYSGGLGVLAGDTIKTLADFRIPAVAIGILWNKGYFKQKFWFKYGQLPEEMRWNPATYPGLIPLEQKIKLELKDRAISLRLWKYYVLNQTRDFAVPLVLLDSNVEENDEGARRLTDRLYRSDDSDARLLQRLILGMGGILAIEALSYPVVFHHLNEGHAAFAFIQKARGLNAKEAEALKSQFVYTCHTPVPAGHDRFSLSDVSRILKQEDFELVRSLGSDDKMSGMVNLTILAMNTSRSVNAVSKKHGEVMRLQFTAYKERIQSVTNGIHFATWASEPILKALDEHASVLGDFRSDPTRLAQILNLNQDEKFRLRLWSAHQENKKKLCDLLSRWKMREDVLTIAWARRIAAYKRPSLIFQDLRRLKELSTRIGPLQILYAGKAHPNDSLAFTYVNEIMNTIDKTDGSEGHLKIIMLENYDTFIAKILVSGVDIWLNNPLPPYEASGTSGMKAIANGILQLSTLDGWVLEAQDKGIGKFFGYQDDGKAFKENMALRLEEDSQALYNTLEEMMYLYYELNTARGFNVHSYWIDMMLNCIAQAGYFNTVRMVREYASMVWQS